MTSRAAVVIVAAGEGSRLQGDRPKQFIEIGGVPMLEWSIRVFEAHAAVVEIVVVVAPPILRAVPDFLAGRERKLVAGGASRRESVSRGVSSVTADVQIILVHDAARPFVRSAVIDGVIAAAETGAAVPTVPLRDTVKEIDEAGRVVGTADRSYLRVAQTPQGFPAAGLRHLHEEAERDALEATDDAMLFEMQGLPVFATPGDHLNFKITTNQDLLYANWLVATGAVVVPPTDRREEPHR